MQKIHMPYVYVYIYIYIYIYVYRYNAVVHGSLRCYQSPELTESAQPIERSWVPYAIFQLDSHLLTWFPGEKEPFKTGKRDLINTQRDIFQVYIGLMIGAPHPKGPPAFFLPWSLLWEFFGYHIFPVGGNEMCCVASGGRCNAPIWGKCCNRILEDIFVAGKSFAQAYLTLSQ